MSVLFRVQPYLRSQRELFGRNGVAFALFSGACMLSWGFALSAEDSPSKLVGTSQPDDDGTVRLTIHPMAEAKPSLAIQLVPDAATQLEGNAAIFYLKAMGFLEQNSARDQLREIQKEAVEQAKETGGELSDFPPFSYVDMHPKDYPKAEVHEYLDGLLSFQVPSLREARLLRDFSMHRNLQLSDNPIGYLLPEMQAMRELARTQSIRCRLAIAEGRVDDAIEVIGQQLTLSRHIGMDDFLVSNLVGVAVIAIACDDTLYLLEHAQCPNLYWAYAQCPDPLVDMTRCLAFERQLFYLQVPKLKEIDPSLKSDAYWTEFLADFAVRTRDFDLYNEGSDRMVSKVQGEGRVESIQKAIEENVSQAREYLLSRGILNKDTIDSYPGEQLVFLAMKDYYEVGRDEQYQLLYMPYGMSQEKSASANEQRKKDLQRYGWFVGVADGWLPNADGWLPNMAAIKAAQCRVQQRIALIQAVEAIRMAGAENGGKLVDSLGATPVPVPNDPFTGKPFQYQVTGDVATLSSEFPTSRPARIELHFAK
jgi:hypothetical protein